MNSHEYINNGVFRKNKGKNKEMYHRYYDAGKQYFEHIQSSTYSAIVFDYDKTIHNKHKKTETEYNIRIFLNTMLERGINICIATGNGEFISNDIRKYFDEAFHDKIIVGYYNGGIICTLDKDVENCYDDVSVPLDFLRVKDFYEKEIPNGCIHEEGIWCQKNPYELNFYPAYTDKGDYYFKQLKLFIRNYTNLKIVKSPHSIDVIPPWISKSDVCKYLGLLGLKQNEILSIGDCGDVDESDYELLCRDHSLSVNSVSPAYSSCWNFAPDNITELEATWFYLQQIQISDGQFTVFR